MKQFYQYIAIFFNFSPTSSHVHSLEVENCDSNSRLEVDEDVNSGLKGLILLVGLKVLMTWGGHIWRAEYIR